MNVSRIAPMALGLIATGALLGAQQTTGIPEVDSAAVARAAWGRANVAARANDVATAYLEARRAATAWPVQPAYLWGRTVLALSAADTAGVRASLQHFATRGLGRDLRNDRRFAGFESEAWFPDLRARLAANVAEVAASRVVATLPDSTFWPEGIDVDRRTRTFYVTSLAHHTVAAISKSGQSREILPRDRADIGRIFAIRVDTVRNVLFATMAAAANAPAALLRVALGDGTIEKRWALPPGAAPHAPGDILVMTGGTVVVSDSRNAALYVLAPAADSLRSIRSPFFYSPQGMVATGDGASLIIADYSIGLLRVELRTGTVSRIADVSTGTSVGLDGIAWDGDELVGIQNGVTPPRVVRIQVDARQGAILNVATIDRHLAIADEPTNGVVIDGEFVYVANSQWDKRDDDGKPLAGAALRRPVLLGVPLRRPR